MNIAEIITRTREDILDDAIQPYLWSNDNLVACLNRSYDELCRETKCLVDQDTSAVCRIDLQSYLGLHTLHSRIVKVLNAWLNSNGWPMDVYTELFMNGYFNWRTTTSDQPYWMVIDGQNRKIRPYPMYDTDGYIAGSSNITFAAGAKTITYATGGLDDHISTGDRIVVSGTTNNNGTFTVSNITDTVITVSSSDTLVNENNTSAVIRLIRDILIMRVARLVVTPYTANDLELSTPPTPEIDATYHYGLMEGIAQYAYLKQDSETYDPEKSKEHKNAFNDFKGSVSEEIGDLKEGNFGQSVPHLGTI